MSRHVLVVDDGLAGTHAAGRAVRALVSELHTRGVDVVEAESCEDGLATVTSDASIHCVLLNWTQTKPGNGNGGSRTAPERAMVDLTPREQHVLAALNLGLPNKLIAARLNLSENTVKMHVQHIMRKCAAHNRTEAVLRWSERLAPETLLH